MTNQDNVIPFHSDGEFLPLPYFPWDRRPSHIPIDVEEAATALYLSDGLIHRAAEKLKVDPLRLTRVINRSPRLQRLHQELAAVLNDKVHEEYIRAFASDDDRRREWAAAKVANTAQFQSHPLAPNAGHQPGPSILASAGRIMISWEESPLLESPSSSSSSSPFSSPSSSPSSDDDRSA